MGSSEILQVVGALIILVAYWAMESGRISPHSPQYLWLNIAGSVLLGLLAVMDELWGFLLLEIAWTGISVRGLTKAYRGGAAESGPH